MDEYECEFGAGVNIILDNCKACDADGKELNYKCKCGNNADTAILGKEAMMWICNDCLYGKPKDIPCSNP